MKNVLISLDEYKRLVARDVEFRQIKDCNAITYAKVREYDAVFKKDGKKEIEDAQKNCEEYTYTPPCCEKRLDVMGECISCGHKENKDENE